MTPNLFIIGAPKCGTSSLFDWLIQHPQIRGSSVKETFFLIDSAHPLARRPNLHADGMPAYATFFAKDDAKVPVRIEATTHYLFDPAARTTIADIAEARAIAVLREPAMRVYSSFQYTANNLARLDPTLTFADYLELVEQGRTLAPKWCKDAGSAYVLERDVEYSRYSVHLVPWMQAMGPDRLNVIIMEEMLEDPQRTLEGLLIWLGLDPGALPTIDRSGRNRTASVRQPRLQAVARGLNARFRPPEPLRHLLKRAYAAIQYRGPQGVPPEDAQALSRLRARFVDDNAQLARLAGLDLQAWH